MAIIYLIRHGQASFGQDNYDRLSDLGHTQATRLGEVLSRRLDKFDAISLGSMYRHEETATNFLKAYDAGYAESNPQVNPGFNEYNHQEIMRVYRPEYSTARDMMVFIHQQDDPKAFFEQEFNAAMNRWISGKFDDQYSESWQDFNNRVHGALDSVIENNKASKSIAVFTSGGPISLISQSLLGVDAHRIMHMNWTLMNCGVTKVVTTGSRRFLASLNEHTHFEGADNKHLITYT